MVGEKRIAVVLFNLGGPDSPAAVQPFLRNLFNDRAIIELPQPLRGLLASLIARRRRDTAQEIYGHLGGGSPLLANTLAQAAALHEALAARAPMATWQCFTAMRYWHPFSGQVAREVAAFAPDLIVLMPLYPQFSKTTTGSSLDDWTASARAAGLQAPTLGVCCYPDEPGFVRDIARATVAGLAGIDGPARVLFSAHGLPQKVVAQGDPYQWQVERTVGAVVAAMAAMAVEDLDWQVCYQSRVGPMAWIGPATDDEIRRAGADGKAVVMVPVAFVSEHSETLVELDIEYREVAAAGGVPRYVRVGTVDTGSGFIGGLADMIVARAVSVEGATPVLCDYRGGRTCPAGYGRCRVAGHG